MYDFIADLDAYFCEKYANYDKLCVLPGYRMPKMQSTMMRDGREYAYTLPPETMRLATQEKKDELLVALKAQMLDTTFSFSFRPYGFFEKIGKAFSKYAFHKALKTTLEKGNISEEELGKQLSVEPSVWKAICKGGFAPTKNLILSIALTAQLSMDDTTRLLACAEYALDYAIVKDVVVSYLLEQRVFNRGMIDAALQEYRVSNLFLKEEE
ncbi:MAG: hypothetical protein IKD47_01330 [Clostridia bacterium]|nr:hypothetical protein [Clostridia bacterium]